MPVSRTVQRSTITPAESVSPGPSVTVAGGAAAAIGSVSGNFALATMGLAAKAAASLAAGEAHAIKSNLSRQNFTKVDSSAKAQVANRTAEANKNQTITYDIIRFEGFQGVFDQIDDIIRNNTELAERRGAAVESKLNAFRRAKAKPESGAFLRIIKGAGTKNEQVLYETPNFILSNVSEVRSEKYMIMETFGLPIGFFFGKRQQIYTFSGRLLNAGYATQDVTHVPDNKQGLAPFVKAQWKNQFLQLYDRALRGTIAAENKTRAVIVYDDVVREGIILNFMISPNADELTTVPFTFNMWILKESIIAPELTGRILDQSRIQAAYESIVSYAGNAVESIKSVFKSRGASESAAQAAAQEVTTTINQDIQSGQGNAVYAIGSATPIVTCGTTVSGPWINPESLIPSNSRATVSRTSPPVSEQRSEFSSNRATSNVNGLNDINYDKDAQDEHGQLISDPGGLKPKDTPLDAIGAAKSRTDAKVTSAENYAELYRQTLNNSYLIKANSYINSAISEYLILASLIVDGDGIEVAGPSTVAYRDSLNERIVASIDKAYFENSTMRRLLKARIVA